MATTDPRINEALADERLALPDEWVRVHMMLATIHRAQAAGPCTSPLTVEEVDVVVAARIAEVGPVAMAANAYLPARVWDRLSPDERAAVVTAYTVLRQMA